jgi:hypothetical protein
MSRHLKLVSGVVLILTSFLFFLPQRIFSQNKDRNKLFDNYYKERLQLFGILLTDRPAFIKDI